ncbi:MAG: glycosyltransferase family 2 protein [Saprospiraceae bacterium]|nr:glycosyltransferase family 2 protein [Saprospiraceae bacterium]
MDISIVVPVFNEEGSLPELVRWTKEALSSHPFSYEMILVDDGSRDNSWSVIRSLKEEYDFIKGLKFTRNYGKSAALQKGFEKARGSVVVTMDADLQDSPEEIPSMYEMIRSGDYEIVSGWKKKRYDPITKTIPTKLYNAVVRAISGIKLNDFNCGLKAYRRDVVKNIEVYGEMHRYIPVMAKWKGYDKIGEKVVAHQARKYGSSKFGMERFIRGPLDLLSILFVGKFGKRPMHFFGVMGILVFVLGFLLFAYIGGSKLYYMQMGWPAKNIANMSWFYIALTSMVIGTQLFLAGFLAELVARNSPDRNTYIIEETL